MSGQGCVFSRLAVAVCLLAPWFARPAAAAFADACFVSTLSRTVTVKPDGSCIASIGTITDGETSPNGATYKTFSVTGGSVTVTYRTPNATGMATVQLSPADPTGVIIGSVGLAGGVWPISVQ
jgi:hypothetical protein